MPQRQYQRLALRGTLLFVLIYIAVATGIIGVAVIYHRHYSWAFRVSAEQQLSSIAALKVSELDRYRSERMSDGAVLLDNPAFSDLVRRAIDEPQDLRSREHLRSWLAKYGEHYDYADAQLLDPSGALRISVSSQRPIISIVSAHLVNDVLADGKVALQDFVRAEQNARVYCSVLVPIFADITHRRALGVIVLLIDPHTHLYPFIARWPTPSRTAETLLVRRDGDDVLFLNELKFRKGTALTLRVALKRAEIAAVKAVLGQAGTVEGLDYRGQLVLAHLARVPQSPWFLVARIDRTEVLGPLGARLRQTVGGAAALMFAAGVGLALIWRQRIVRHYREQAAKAAALQALTSHQEALLSTVPDIILELNTNGVCTWANQTGLEFFGEDVIGHVAAFDFSSEQAAHGALQPLCEGSKLPAYTESWQLRKDGQKRLLACRRGKLTHSDGGASGAIYSARDVTEQRSAEQELAVRVSLANVFLSSSDEQMYPAVLKVILDVTRSPCGMFGYLDEAGDLVIPAAYGSVVNNQASASGTYKMQTAATDQSIWPEAVRDKLTKYTNGSRAPRTANTVTHSRQVCVPVLLRGEVVGLFQVANRATDYTDDDRRFLDTIAKYVAPVLHARLTRKRREEELQQRNDEMMRLLYAVSHDLKSPLVTITTFVGYLEKDMKLQSQAAICKDFEFIRNAAATMSQRLDAVLALSRIGRKTSAVVQVALQQVVSEALGLTAGCLAARGVIVKVTEEPILLVGDQSRLVEVFQNLIDNAAKFMGKQPNPKVDIGVEYTSEGPVLFVGDNGIGIDLRHQSKVFGLFEKLDPHSEGSGIGLSLVQRIVQIHGGTIWVESKGPGTGTTIRFTLAKSRRAVDQERAS